MPDESLCPICEVPLARHPTSACDGPVLALSPEEHYDREMTKRRQRQLEAEQATAGAIAQARERLEEQDAQARKGGFGKRKGIDTRPKHHPADVFMTRKHG